MTTYTGGVHGSVWQDIRSGWAQQKLWRFLARQSLARQYNRTVIGTWWIPLNLIIHVTLLGLVYSQVFRGSHGGHYFAYYGCSYAIWTVIGRTLGESSTLWQASSVFMLQLPTPRSLFIFQMVYKLLRVFVMAVIVGFGIALINGARPGMIALEAIPGTGLFFLNVLWIVVVVSIGSAWLPDVARFLPNFILLIYLVTPIIWSKEQLGDHQWVATINPIYHLVELVRGPLLGSPVSTLTWMVTGGMAVVGNVLGVVVLAAGRRRIPLWL